MSKLLETRDLFQDKYFCFDWKSNSNWEGDFFLWQKV